MKILYIAAEHVSGTLSLFKEEHERRGDECRFVTFWHSRWDFPDDICLNLPLMPDKAWVRGARRFFHAIRPLNETVDNRIPYWNPSRIEQALFAVRDRYLWPRIVRAIRKYDLASFDMIQLDGGLDFTRDARFALAAKKRNARIAAFYHGSDFRTRGVIREIDEIADLRMTSEWDLLESDTRLRYLYLPFRTADYPDRPYRFHSRMRIAHASRNPYKGTSFVIGAIRSLAKKYPVELILLENLSHAETLRKKNECDIFVDQLTNAGGWGYGMSSVEALAMGMPVVTNIPDKMAQRLGEHPFVQADEHCLHQVLESLISNERQCSQLADYGREWVRARHDIHKVADQLYSYYADVGWMNRT